MESVETALKTSLRKDIMTTTVKLIPQTFTDENGTTCDDFFVDDLLDFSHVEEPQDSENQHKEEKKEEEEENSLQKENQSYEISNPATSFSLKDDYGSLPTNDLNVPTDDVADLEWLSHFVEDSFSEFSSALPAVTLTENPKCVVTQKPEPKPKPEQQNPVFSQPCLKFKTPIQIQTKARSKRTRTSIRVWPFGSPCFTESSSSSTTTTTSSSSSSPTSPLLIFPNLAQSLDQFSSEGKPPAAAKKAKKGTSLNGVGSGAAVPAPRRCTHCGVQKTPQWRTGPLGAKTLCNACGVRFKSGRLLPEYRPACSPTFSTELHSNHHRKVLEMRRKKEVIDGVEIETGLSPASVVPSF